MNNNFSLEQLSKTGNLDSILIFQQNKIEIMAKFLEIKSVNQKIIQDQIE